jgi:hypothetical protein
MKEIYNNIREQYKTKLADQIVKFRQSKEQEDTLFVAQDQLVEQTESPREQMSILFGERVT